MTMTDTPDTPPAAPKPKRKYHRRANRRRAAATGETMQKPDVPKEFEGLTVADCCDDCNVTRCVISGKPYCAHPAKGGLHTADMMNPEAVQRYKRAKRVLGEAKLNLQHG
jgi:hypothetical protein